MRFQGRLRALGTIADLVLAGKNVSLDTGTLIRATLAPFMEENSRISIAGPTVRLGEQTGGSLALAMHELATNAIKYGALSAASGKVAVSWTMKSVPKGQDVVFEWKETGGPQPAPPQHEGFGSRVIRGVPAREKSGDVHIEYRPDGLYCRMAFTLCDSTPDGPALAA